MSSQKTATQRLFFNHGPPGVETGFTAVRDPVYLVAPWPLVPLDEADEPVICLLMASSTVS